MALTDPSDWPGSMPDLRTIDNLLRCSICFEYLNVAMIIPSCSHNYCSLCIRRYLKYKRQCPSCNTEVSASELCNNRTLDELVKTFVAVRPHILKLCKKTEVSNQHGDPTEQRTTQLSNSIQSPVEDSTLSPKKSSGTLTGHFTSIKHPTNSLLKTSEPCHASTSGSTTTISKERPSNLQNASSKSLHSYSSDKHTNENNVDDDDVIEIDDDYDTDQSTASKSQSPVPDLSMCTPSRRQSSPNVSNSTPSGSQSVPGTSQSGAQITPGGSRDKAECPVCGVPVPTKYINTHLDACLKRRDETQTKKRASKRKRIPAMVWKLVPDKELRKKLKEYNLSSKGKRYEWSKRLDEFILMYNAQCDAANPKSAGEIAREVERMEQLKTQPQQVKEAQVHRLKVEKGQTEEQIEKSQYEYLDAHQDQFATLVAQTRERMRAVKKKQHTQESCPQEPENSCLDPNEESTACSSKDNRDDKESLSTVCTNSSAGEDKVKHSGGVVSDEVMGREEGDSPNEEGNSPKEEGDSPKDRELNEDVLMLEGGDGAEETPGDDEKGRKFDELGLASSFSDSALHQQSDLQVLAPSSPSVTSGDGNEDNRPEEPTEIKNVCENNTPDAQEPLCIPESPLSVVAETRRRKRKKQDHGSNASDSGSSFGDSETTLRRSKRERKSAK